MVEIGSEKADALIMSAQRWRTIFCAGAAGVNGVEVVNSVLAIAFSKTEISKIRLTSANLLKLVLCGVVWCGVHLEAHLFVNF